MHLPQGCPGFSDRDEPEESRGLWETDSHRAQTERKERRGIWGMVKVTTFPGPVPKGRGLL